MNKKSISSDNVKPVRKTRISLPELQEVQLEKLTDQQLTQITGGLTPIVDYDIGPTK